MALQLKKGPKNQIWDECVAVHRGDGGKREEDKFELLVRIPTDDDEAHTDSLDMLRALGMDPVLVDDPDERIDGGAAADDEDAEAPRRAVRVLSMPAKRKRIEEVKDYLRRNVLGMRKLIDADNNEVEFTEENFEQLMNLPAYRTAMVNTVMLARQAPEAAGKKSSKR